MFPLLHFRSNGSWNGRREEGREGVSRGHSKKSLLKGGKGTQKAEVDDLLILSFQPLFHGVREYLIEN